MAEMLLINPRRRRAAPKRRKASAKRRRNPIANLGAYVKRRRRNPVAALARRTVKRRRNPIASLRAVSRRRRRNPSGLGLGLSASSLMNQFKDALVGGAGAVAVDAAMGQINRFLPASMQRVPGAIGVGDAVKAVLTVALGNLLSKPTRGLSRKMASGALTVQAHELIASFVPAAMPMGYASPARIVQGTNRVGPIRQGVNGLGAYVRSGTPLLSAYQRPGTTALLNRAKSSREREGFAFR